MIDNFAAHHPALLATLQLAVPLHIDRLRDRTAEQLVAVAHRCADIVSAEGDNLMFRARKRGATARSFNALAEGLAALAYAPGGVEFAGLRWAVPAGQSPLHPHDIADQLVDLRRITLPTQTAATAAAGDLL